MTSSSGWQSNQDLPTRRMMIHKLLWVFQRKRHAISSLLDASIETRLPSLVRRLELALYLRAASLNEYLYEASLSRRVQHLIVSLQQGKAPSLAEPATQQMLSKRATVSRPNTPPRKKSKHSSIEPATSVLFLDNQEAIIDQVFAYLDGTEIVQCMTINRFAAAFLPTTVRYLDVSWSQLTHLVASRDLARFRRLERLQVIGSTSITSTNQMVARHLAAFLPPTLERLTLSNTYIHTEEVNATAVLCHVLATRCRRLTHLSLAGNALGDAGMACVASLLVKSHVPALVYLDIRRNYIGEGGVKALATAVMADGPPLALETLLLGSNIAAHGVPALATSFQRRRLPKLRILGLQDNFIDLNGVESLAAVLEQGACPSLHELSIGDNSADNRTIQSIFAFATARKE
ncbi:hypothetical protein AeMF1_010690 [Aphanomyces euteiches]|nr:hypothetical protein AeMF1_010690 [Aphanomyces euteiches]